MKRVNKEKVLGNFGKHSIISVALQALVLAGLALIFGLVGATTFLLATIFMTTDYLADDLSKGHGVSHVHPRRIGGLILLINVLVVLAFGIFGFLQIEIGEALLSSLQDKSVLGAVGVASGLFFLGLLDDAQLELGPSRKLALQVALIVSGISMGVISLPKLDLSFLGFGYGQGQAILLSVSYAIFLVGFINAINIADGLNGLVSGLAIVFSIIVFYLERNLFALLPVIALAPILVLNLLTGRLILGDSGALLLGFTICVTSVELFNQGKLSPWLSACIFTYPCIEMLSAIVRRAPRGMGRILEADDAHVHNRLYRVISGTIGPTAGNSASGLLIVLGTVGLPAFFLFFWKVDPGAHLFWLILFLTQAGILILVNVILPHPKLQS